MPPRMPPISGLRTGSRFIPKPQCLRQFPQSLPSRQQSTFGSKPRPPPDDRPDPITLHRLEWQRRAYYKKRSYYAAAGWIFGMIGMWVTVKAMDLPPKPTKLDSGRRTDDPLVGLDRERKVVVQKLGEEPEESVDTVKTGNSTVPTFPRLLDFRDEHREGLDTTIEPAQADDRLVEYQLVGCGIRSVSFLGVQVYVVGMYIATDDIATLQSALIREIDGSASTLVAGEKEELRTKLYDADEGVRIWNDVLKKSGVRTVFRIVPTRNTDFHHLRDAWVRSLTERAQANKEEYGDEQFGISVNEFKSLFNRGSVPKQKELLLSRDRQGKLAVWYDDGKNGSQRLGQIVDERMSRGIWLNYLAGKKVASEAARKNIIDGVIGFVERPVGTVATQVV